jgi:hypothetical protein
LSKSSGVVVDAVHVEVAAGAGAAGVDVDREVALSGGGVALDDRLVVQADRAPAHRARQADRHVVAVGVEVGDHQRDRPPSEEPMVPTTSAAP